jgi:hypothetical protein
MSRKRQAAGSTGRDIGSLARLVALKYKLCSSRQVLRNLQKQPCNLSTM